MTGIPQRFALAAIALLIALSAGKSQNGLPGDRFGDAGGFNEHVIEGCTVRLINILELPASEAGMLTVVNIEPGDQIQTEAVLAKIDPRPAELAVQRFEKEHELARMQAEDTIEIEYAELNRLVEKEDWLEVLEANHDVKGAVPEAEVRRQRHEYDRARSGLKKAKKDQELAHLTAQVKGVELAEAKLALDRRVVLAPYDGEVLKLHRETGEWVRPGDVIAELVRLDELQVDGMVDYDDYSPGELEDCRVTIEVRAGRNRDGSPRVVEASGWVSYINPIPDFVNGKQRYSVRAKITNRREAPRRAGALGRWLISPNMKATMKIHLGTAGERRIGERAHETRVAK